MRNMSFAMTTTQLLLGTKTVTRRTGWQFLKPGDLVQAVEKCQGIKKGEKIKKLAVIRIVSVDREPLNTIILYGPEELACEGFPNMDAWDFIDMFCGMNKCKFDTEINRIEFEKVEP